MKLKVNNEIYCSPVMDDNGHIFKFKYKYEILEYNNEDILINRYFIGDDQITKEQEKIIVPNTFLDINNETVQDIYLLVKNMIGENPISNVPFDSDYLFKYFDFADKFYPGIKSYFLTNF